MRVRIRAEMRAEFVLAKPVLRAIFCAPESKEDLYGKNL
jgi:hypothetical protein